MRKHIRYLAAFIMLVCVTNVYAIPANDMFEDDNLYKCIIDAYNVGKEEKKDYSYSLLTYEITEITTLDCSKYKGLIEDLTGLSNLSGLTSINLSGNMFLGGSLRLNEGETGTLTSSIKLPKTLILTDSKYTIADSKIVSVKDGIVTGIKEGSTYVTMTSKIADNEIQEKYLVSVVSKTPKSTNNNLKTLTINNGELRFNKNTLDYTIVVPNSVKTIKMSAIPEDLKSTFADGYGPRGVNLKIGANKVLIKVMAEDKSVKTYTLNITRSDGNDDNNLLANIELSVGKIDFKSDVTIYNLTVGGDVSNIEVNATPISLLSKVKVGDTDLKIGDNKITITVTAENGSTKDYQLIVTRENYESNKNYLKELIIKDYDIKFDKKTSNYTINIGNEKELKIIPTKETTNSTVSIIGNKDLKNDSKIIIKVTDEDNAIRDYTLTIKKLFIYDMDYRQMLVFSEFIIILLLLIVIIIKPKKRKKKRASKKKFIQNKVCMKCGAINNNTSKTCYVCGKELK